MSSVDIPKEVHRRGCTGRPVARRRSASLRTALRSRLLPRRSPHALPAGSHPQTTPVPQAAPTVSANELCVRIGVGPIQAVKPTFSATAGARDGGVPSQARAGCPFAAAHSGWIRRAPVWHSHCRRPDYFLEQYTASVSTVSWERGHTPRGDSLYKEESPEVQTPGKKRC